MTERTARPRRGRLIRASEIGEYVYCHRAWWLGRVAGVENANRAQLDAGIERHRTHGRRLRRAFALQSVALLLLAAALFVAVVLAWLVLMGSR
ncbi:MAG: hypothetical protein ACM3JD_07385 [Rudaea sp.]